MKNKTYQLALAVITLTACLLSTNVVKAAPVKINQVVQVVNAKPGKAKTGGFTQLKLADDDNLVVNTSKDESQTPQDDRVIKTTTIEVVEDEQCDCVEPQPPITRGGFPKWALLGLAAIPVGVVLLNRKDSTPTPTPTTTNTPPTTATPTPATPTPTPTSTPTITPTPEPVPEPMTILLFGTGLAGIGVAARRRLRKKTDDTEL